MASIYGADVESNALMVSVTADETFTIPDVDLTGAQYTLPGGDGNALFQPVAPVTVADLTTGIGGTGVFDAMMATYQALLQVEYKANRITGAEYTKAFLALTQGAMQGAVQFVLGKDQAYWQSQTAQVGVISAMVGLETAKVQMVNQQLEAVNAKARYALTKLQMAGESVQYGTAVFQLSTMLPAQKLLLTQQLAQAVAQTSLVTEQIETARASTTNNRSDGTLIVGTLGAQKTLYLQQVTSYMRNAEVTAAKIFTDAWITQKTMDDGLDPPNGFTNTNIDTILTTLVANNNLG